MTDWCTLLTFDVMNHLAFGESSGSIKSRKVSPHVREWFYANFFIQSTI